jgi:4-alpha-glucanotransferase
LFFLDGEGAPTVVAGVPPDYFSATGQRWGNPLYRWDVMHADGFTFWVDRMRTQMRLYDMIRIDHFRGFEAYWEIPAAEPDAVRGRWVPGPGDLVFDRLRDALGALPLVAEDLGVITEEVKALRDRQGMPGMHILQFAFSGGPENPYLPFHHTENSVVYTGTHDNDTTLGWYRSLEDQERSLVDEYLGHSRDPMPWPLIHAALMSTARLAAVPLQDLLGLDGSHRMNLPGTTDGNWTWRFDWEQVPSDLAEQVRHLLWMTARLPD